MFHLLGDKTSECTFLCHLKRTFHISVNKKRQSQAELLARQNFQLAISAIPSDQDNQHKTVWLRSYMNTISCLNGSTDLSSAVIIYTLCGILFLFLIFNIFTVTLSSFSAALPMNMQIVKKLE